MLSSLRRRDRHPRVAAWVEAQRGSELYVSIVTIGEVERGIERQRVKAPAFAAALATWLDRVLALYGERVLPFDRAAARRWGRLSAAVGNDGADLMIAGDRARARPHRCHPQRPPLRADRRRPPGPVCLTVVSWPSIGAADDWKSRRHNLRPLRASA